GVPRAVAIVRAFGAQHEPVQATWSAYGVEPVLAPGQQLVHVGLVAHVKQEAVARGMEYVVQRDGEFHHAQVGAKMPAVVGKDSDQPFAYFRRQLFEFGKGELPYLLGRIDAFEYACHSQRESAFPAGTICPQPAPTSRLANTCRFPAGRIGISFLSGSIIFARSGAGIRARPQADIEFAVRTGSATWQVHGAVVPADRAQSAARTITRKQGYTVFTQGKHYALTPRRIEKLSPIHT